MVQIKTKVLQHKKITNRCLRFALQAPGIAKLAIPGQFVSIKVSDTDEPLLRRPLSIHKVTMSLGHHVPSEIEILYEVKGRATEILAQKKLGECLDIIGPLGNGFNYKSPCPHVPMSPVLVAGGMGVAPLFFLAEKITECKIQNTKCKILVLIGAKTKNQILCEKEFKKLGCDVKIATDDGSRGFKGRVTDLLREILATRPGGYQATSIYSCGPRPMLKEIAAISKKHKVPAQVSLEEHMACGIGACLGCVVRVNGSSGPPVRPADRQASRHLTTEYKRVCKDGPVFNAEELIW